MIRKSTAIGVIALMISLVLHFLGIGLTFTTEPPVQVAESVEEAVALGEAFDDIADFEAEPVVPEPAEAPEPVEPPVEETPQPEEVEAPTSQALVASPNPQNTPSPDTGISAPVQSDPSGPVTPETGDTPDPEIATPSAGSERAISDATLAPPVAPEGQSDAPEGDLSGAPEVAFEEPVEPEAATPPSSTDAERPADPVEPPDVIAALPPDIVAPVPEDIPDPQEQEQPEPEAGTPSESTKTTSLRPQLRPRTPAQVPQGVAGGTGNRFDEFRAPSDVIESPLTAYTRDGTNLFAGQRGGRQSTGQGFGGGRGPGNSDVTNYAGMVLVHLNRVQPVALTARGWARVVFRINPDGSLASVNIIDGSGSLEIETAAKSHIRRAEPFPRPPDNRVRMLSFIYQNR